MSTNRKGSLIIVYAICQSEKCAASFHWCGQQKPTTASLKKSPLTSLLDFVLSYWLTQLDPSRLQAI